MGPFSDLLPFNFTAKRILEYSKVIDNFCAKEQEYSRVYNKKISDPGLTIRPHSLKKTQLGHSHMFVSFCANYGTGILLNVVKLTSLKETIWDTTK